MNEPTMARSFVKLLRCTTTGRGEFSVVPAPGWRMCVRGMPIGSQPQHPRLASRWEYISPDGAPPVLQMLVEHLIDGVRAATDAPLSLVQIMRVTLAAKSGAAFPESLAEQAIASFLGDEMEWFELERPVCPRCDGETFKEAQLVAVQQLISWDDRAQVYTYGESEFGDIDETEGLSCAACGLQLPTDYLKEWT